jgi:WD40 repeat protein
MFKTIISKFFTPPSDSGSTPQNEPKSANATIERHASPTSESQFEMVARTTNLIPAMPAPALHTLARASRSIQKVILQPPNLAAILGVSKISLESLSGAEKMRQLATRANLEVGAYRLAYNKTIPWSLCHHAWIGKGEGLALGFFRPTKFLIIDSLAGKCSTEYALGRKDKPIPDNYEHNRLRCLFSPSGVLAVVLLKNKVNIVDTKTGQTVKTLPAKTTPLWATWAPNGKKVALTFWNQNFVEIYDTVTQATRRAAQDHPWCWGHPPKWSGDSKNIYGTPQQGEFLMHSVEASTAASWPNSVNFRNFTLSASSRYAIAEDRGDRSIKILERNSMVPLHQFENQSSASAIAFSPDEKYVLFQSFPTAAHLVPLDGSSAPMELDVKHSTLARNAWSPDSQHLLVQDGKTFCVLSAETGQPLWSTKPFPTTRSIASAWAPDGQHIAYLPMAATQITADTREVRIVACTEPHTEFTVPIASTWPRNVFWSPDGSRLAVHCHEAIHLLDFGGDPVSQNPGPLGSPSAV